MAVLPNRFLVKLDPANDFFKTYQHPLGVLRLTVESGSNFGEELGQTRNFLKKLVHDVPDCFVDVNVAGGPEWRTKTVKNNHHPEWNETQDFLVADHDQAIEVDVKDDDTASDDDIGLAATTVKQLLLAGGRQELRLVHKQEQTDGKLALSGKFHRFVPDAASLSGTEDGVLGLVTVLVASVRGITGRREDLKPSVKVEWGDQLFRTAVKTDAPGTDIENPSFDRGFQFPVKSGMVGGGAPVKITLMDAENETGSVAVELDEVLGAEGMKLEKDFDVGHGVTVRAGIWLRGTKLAE
jgi:Ca2+-dependent lipid-binding protein